MLFLSPLKIGCSINPEREEIRNYILNVCMKNNPTILEKKNELTRKFSRKMDINFERGMLKKEVANKRFRKEDNLSNNEFNTLLVTKVPNLIKKEISYKIRKNETKSKKDLSQMITQKTRNDNKSSNSMSNSVVYLSNVPSLSLLNKAKEIKQILTTKIKHIERPITRISSTMDLQYRSNMNGRNILITQRMNSIELKGNTLDEYKKYNIKKILPKIIRTKDKPKTKLSDLYGVDNKLKEFKEKRIEVVNMAERFRNYFQQNRAIPVKAKELKGFLNKVNPDINEYKRMIIKEKVKV